jgi:UDP-glucose 4-epimerase
MNLLLTGGTGYIGSHTAVVLAEAGHRVVLFDNLSNSQIGVVDRLETILGQRPIFVQGDIRDASLLERVLNDHAIEAVVHFAGLKAVGESVTQPLAYYHNNVYGSLCLLQAMQKAYVKRLVFSSSATVYGQPVYLPYDELHPISPTNPYGHNKAQVERILADLADSDPDWRIASLRYFNPVGAHESGLIGENPNGIPNNLMPFIARVAAGTLPELAVYGGDYPTLDGTGVRDYIHVMDLADGHLAALEFLEHQPTPMEIFNIGTGKGVSVLEMVAAFEAASGVRIPYKIVDRRPGDIAEFYADSSKAMACFPWLAKRDLPLMCESAWRFQSQIESALV